MHMKLMILALTLLCLAAPAVAEIDEEAFARYLEREQEATEQEIERVTEWIRGHRDRLRAVGEDQSLNLVEKRERRRELTEEVRAERERLQRLRAGEESVVPAISLADAETGDIGQINSRRARVFQVTDDQNVMVELHTPAHYRYSTVYHGIRPSQQRVHVPARTTGPYWLEGIDTSELVDGETIPQEELEGIVFVRDGTRQYETAIGSTVTVPLFRVIDLAELREKHEEQGR